MSRAWRLAALGCALVLGKEAGAQSLGQIVREAHITGVLVGSERTIVAGPLRETTTGTGTLKGVDGVLRFGGIGLRGRMLSGDLSGLGTTAENEFTLQEVAVAFGPRIFAVEGGARRRTGFPGDTSDKVSQLRADIRSEWTLTGGSVLVTLTAGIIANGTFSTLGELDPTGHDAEVTVLVQPVSSVPLFAQFGYRYESYDAPEVLTGRSEEMHGVWVGFGLRGWR